MVNSRKSISAQSPAASAAAQKKAGTPASGRKRDRAEKSSADETATAPAQSKPTPKKSDAQTNGNVVAEVVDDWAGFSRGEDADADAAMYVSSGDEDDAAVQPRRRGLQQRATDMSTGSSPAQSDEEDGDDDEEEADGAFLRASIADGDSDDEAAQEEEDAFADVDDDDDDDGDDDDVYVSDDEEMTEELKQYLGKDAAGEALSDVDEDDDDDEDGVRVLASYESVAPAGKQGEGEEGEDVTAKSWFEKKEKTQPSLFDDVERDDDSSEDENMDNRIGKVPLEWYEEYDHIGYDKDGKKIIKRKKKDALDHFIARNDDPNYLRTVYDEVNDKEYVVSAEDLENIMRIAQGKFPSGFNPYRPYVDWVKYDSRFPLVGNMESKAKFLPNRDEMKIINRIAERMRRGWIKPKHVLEREKEEQMLKEERKYLMWGEDGQLTDKEFKGGRASRGLAPPKIDLPGHADSYNPPAEYVTDRNKDRVRSNMRTLPQYDNYVQEVFERCLDLYLAPRVEVKQVHVDEPKKLLPELPKPDQLRPFPEIFSLSYHGHTDVVRTISVDPTGRWIASGSNDHTVRLWEIDTGRCTRIWAFKGDVKWVEWNPNPKLNLLAVAVQNFVYLVQPPESGNEESNGATEALFPTKAYEGEGVDGEDFDKDALFIDADEAAPEEDGKEKQAQPEDKQASYTAASESKSGRQLTLLKWTFYRSESEKGVRKQGILVCLTHLHEVTQVSWHHRGDYFVSLAPAGYSSGIVMHQMSRRESQRPFKRKVQEKGETFVKVLFHPKKPLFFVATKTRVKAYDLVRQKIFKRLKNGKCRFISSFDVHPTGGHVLIGGYDKRFEWYDMELTSKPFKTFRFHDKAIRGVTFHQKYPLFATCSDDGTVHVFHNTVYDDWLKDPMIVPVKVLKGHRVTSYLGVMSLAFHPVQPWIFTCGADTSIRLYTA